MCVFVCSMYADVFFFYIASLKCISTHKHYMKKKLFKDTFPCVFAFSKFPKLTSIKPSLRLNKTTLI